MLPLLGEVVLHSFVRLGLVLAGTCIWDCLFYSLYGQNEMTRLMYDLEKIRNLATVFRNAIETTKDELSRFAPKLENFPKNCCGVAASLLAKFLSVNDCGEFVIESGERANNELHHWLRQDELIVDITADQFPDRKERVIVSTDDSWHRAFKNDHESHLADYERYSQAARSYSKMYEIITKHISSG